MVLLRLLTVRYSLQSRFRMAEAIPLDQEVLAREQWKLKDFIESLKRTEQKLKVTFLANPYLFSMYFLDRIPNLQSLRQQAEAKAKKKDNSGVKA